MGDNMNAVPSDGCYECTLTTQTFHKRYTMGELARLNNLFVRVWRQREMLEVYF